MTDLLTMLPNRKGINEHLIELARADGASGNENEPGAAVPRLDKFSDINDQHGHLAGDNVLAKVVAERLRECLPRSAFSALGRRRVHRRVARPAASSRCAWPRRSARS